MLKKIMILFLAVVSQSANAYWVDADYNATIRGGTIYCSSQRNLMEFGGYAQDGNEAAANRMVRNGECSTTNRAMTVYVVQINRSKGLVNFVTPGKKLGYTFEEFVQ